VVTELSLKELVLGCVAGDGDAALEGWAVLCVPIIRNGFHPIQPLPLGLTETEPAVSIFVVGNSETAQVRDRICEGFTRPGPDSCTDPQERTPGKKESHPLSLLHSHVSSTLFYESGTPILGGRQQAEKTQQAHFLDLSPAFPRNCSPVKGELYLPQACRWS
jgi:hypothetical protein